MPVAFEKTGGFAVPYCRRYVCCDGGASHPHGLGGGGVGSGKDGFSAT